ncbi:MAG TPA: hypothetical protein VM261_27875 [Kofleriaceae bacterium]|nr:hypothetical protein [Kofleriaceae bacterium]
MSALDRPRLHFFGQMSVSTPTVNNNNWDLVIEPQQCTLYPKFLAMSDDQFRLAMRQLVMLNLGIIHEGMMPTLEGNWNFYGDNSVVWNDATITAYDPPGGGRVTSGDPAIGLPVAIAGNAWGDATTPAIIVDADPTSDFSSQMFIPSFTVGTATGTSGFAAQSNDQVAVPRTHSRWLDQFRNLAEFPDACFAATWQLPLPTGTLAFTPGSSPALAAMAAAAQAGQGLVVRFATYFFNRLYTDPQLAKLFAMGKTIQNASVGVVMGTIAPWLPGEWGNVPGGRRLNPNQDPQAMLQNPLPDRFVGPYQLAPATAGLTADGKTMVLDLVAAFRDTQLPPPPPPSADPNPTNLNPTPPPSPSVISKADEGPATLQVVDASGTVHDIGLVPYDQASYVAGSGIVELPVPDGMATTIANGTLQIVAPQRCALPLLIERPLVSESDDRATYVTLGQSATVTVNVRSHGVPAATVPVTVLQYRSLEILSPSPDGSHPIPEKQTLPVPGPDPKNPVAPVVTVSPQGGFTDANGNLALTITGVDAGMCILLLTPDGQAPPDNLNGFSPAWTWLYFVHVRVLPADADLDAIPDDQITWDLVYEKVLRYYYKVFPTMDQHLMLNDKQACMNAAQMLLLMTDPSAWDSTLYMPITREMSDGKRNLLHRWCRRVMAGITT